MWKLLKGTVVSFVEDEALSRGAAIAFYTVTSLAPVLLIVIAIAGLVFGHEAAQNAIMGQLSGLMGTQTAEILQTAIASAAGKSSGILATMIGVATLLVTASGIFGEMQTALNKIWKAKPKSGTVSRLIRARAASLGLVAALGFLLMVSLVVSAGLTALGDYLNSILPFGSLILSVLNFIVSLALLSVLFAAIYKLLPDRPIAWRDVVVGAGVTAVLFTAGKSLIGWYLGSSAVASSYGAAGGLILLLLWVYYSAQIFLLGAEFTRVYATRHGSRQEDEDVQSDAGKGSEATDRAAISGAGTKAVGPSSLSISRTANAEGDMVATEAHDPSLAQLERNAERHRAALGQTVDALQSRLSPSALKEDVREYVRDTGQGILRNLQIRARENPLQAAAVAAGVAYPLWRLVARIPVPILLIGAGLALIRRPGEDSTGTGSNDQGFMSKARESVGDATHAAKQKLGEVSESVQQTVQSVRQTAEQTSGKMTEVASKVSQGTGQLTAAIGDKVSRTAEAARTMTTDAVSTAAEMASSGYRSGTEAAARAGEQAIQAGQRTQHAVVDTIHRHPMIAGAIGLAIGAALAAALPATRQENRLLGDASGQLKSKARELASEGVEAVKTAAGEVYEETLQHARDEGLSSEGLRETLKDVGEKVKTAVGRVTGEGRENEQAPRKPAPNSAYKGSGESI